MSVLAEQVIGLLSEFVEGLDGAATARVELSDGLATALARLRAQRSRAGIRSRLQSGPRGTTNLYWKLQELSAGADSNDWSKEAMTMLMRTDPFRELDRLTQQVFGQQGTWSRPVVMPTEAYRAGEEFVVHFDLPGVDPASIDVNVARNVLTVKAERRLIADGEQVETLVAERPHGAFSRQLFLGEALDTHRIEAHYDAGVLTLHIPVAEQAKPRKIEVSAGNGKQLTG